jgi:serine/threonine protein kinase
MRECSVCHHCFPDHVETCERDGALTKPTLPVNQFFKQRYRLIKRLGRGSTSVVYQAIDEQAGAKHAIKIIRPEYVGNNPTAARAYLSQAKAAFALRHANIVTITDSGISDESLLFLVMDFIDGASLAEILSRSGPLTPAAAFEYLKGIGNGLSCAHSAGILHGDLKPRNILIMDGQSPAEAVRITDFGLSAIKSGKFGESTEEAGGLLRSPVYLAPEEWSEDQPDARSDIYSLGVILYQMLTGDPPFKGKSTAAIMKSHLRDPVPSLAERFPDVTIEVERVVFHALEKDPARRPESVESFIEEFHAALTSGFAVYEPIIAADHPGAEQRWSATIQSVLLVLGVVLVIALIGIGVYYSRMSQ